MTNRSFAFIIHPVNPKRDVERKYPFLGRALTARQIDLACTFWPPLFISRIEGVTSQSSGESIDGWFLAVPYTPRRMLELPTWMVYDKIVAAGRMAEKLGAGIMGLGAFTAVVGDAGETIARRLEIPVTTGDSYTVAVAVSAAREAAQQMGLALKDARTAIVGATGAIGRAAAQMLAGEVASLSLVGRRSEALEAVRELCEGQSAQVSTSVELSSIHQADLILTMTSSIGAIIEPQHLRPGAVVCDLAVPNDVSRAVAAQRDDVLVIEGGMVQTPGPVNFNFDFGYPPRTAYACMAETMALALEGRFEDYTIGRDLEIERVRAIDAICTRHGFRLAGLRSFAREVTPEQIARVRERADARLRALRPATAG